MAAMSLRSVNLNLLPILQALLVEGSVTRAARTLGLSQSAMSDALGRLRATLGDPLLVRTGGRTTLTPRATALIAPTQALCSELDAFFARPRFDPSTARRTFTVATPDYGIFLVAKPWLDRLTAVAPNVALRFFEIGADLPDQLAERAIDFTIVPETILDDLAPIPLSHLSLGSDRAMAVFRAGHPLGEKAALDVTDVAAHRQIGFNPGSETVARRRGELFSGGRRFATNLWVPHITLMPYLLLDGDDVAIVPERLAARMTALLPLAAAPLAFAPAPVHNVLAWSPVQEADPGHRWFRETIASSV